MREERKRLEWTRQELLRKGKDLLAQNRHRRNQGGPRFDKELYRCIQISFGDTLDKYQLIFNHQFKKKHNRKNYFFIYLCISFLTLVHEARDSWKKKYFETKKATAPLEDTLKNLRQDLETFYNKLLHQLHARDSRGKPRQQGRSSVKVKSG